MKTQNRHMIYLGYCVSEESARSLSGVSIAGNNMQISVLSRLFSNKRISTSSFTVYPVAAFPRDKKLYYKKANIPITDEIASLRASFINIPLIKQVMQALSLYRNAKPILRNKPNAIIFTYNAYPQTGMPALWLKRKYPNCLFILFLPDPPLDENPDRGALSRLLYNNYRKITEKIIKKTDKLIVLNKHAAKLYAPDKPYIVIDGGVEADNIPIEVVPIAAHSRKIIYSGRLAPYSGIINLIDAMDMIKTKDLVLHIYGDGIIREKVADRAMQTCKVEYMGTVDNKTMKEIQRDAYLLINPRPVDDPIAMVTFPSKIFEYLVSGTPVLTTRLNGFTEEYYDKMLFTETNEPKELASKIDEIMAMLPQKLEEMTQRARKFVLEEKNWDKQMQKVVEFISEDTGISNL